MNVVLELSVRGVFSFLRNPDVRFVEDFEGNAAVCFRVLLWLNENRALGDMKQSSNVLPVDMLHPNIVGAPICEDDIAASSRVRLESSCAERMKHSDEY